jgi:hypothetical protein
MGGEQSRESFGESLSRFTMTVRRAILSQPNPQKEKGREKREL